MHFVFGLGMADLLSKVVEPMFFGPLQQFCSFFVVGLALYKVIFPSGWEIPLRLGSFRSRGDLFIRFCSSWQKKGKQSCLC